MRGFRATTAANTRPAQVLGVAIMVLVAFGCELTEVTIAAPEDVIIAETQVILALDPRR